ncbi:zinc finger protein 879 [Drosophila biarmipes]|uniref:zinc finger protein 879 n=1 Tax=Drosophila biarmipes TaxID=125945 RepID=UPI0007E75CC8|nr:zinc finger protein 879 [Drosophila biarmipes]
MQSEMPRICRVCLVPSEDGPTIFECTSESGHSIKKILSLPTGFEVCQGDTFPETICPPCLQDAMSALEIRQVSEKSKRVYCQQSREFLQKSNALLNLSHDGEDEDYLSIEGSKETNCESAQSKGDLLETDKNEECDYKPETETIEDIPKRLRAIEPYNCPYCSKIFKGRTHYKQHLRVHTGERPFKCSQCTNAFKTLGALHGHLRTHTKERPLSCPHCPTAFRQSSTLLAELWKNTCERDRSHVTSAQRTLQPTPASRSSCYRLKAFY